MIGKKIQYYPSLASTNSTARELAEKGEPEGTIVLSEFQSSGKGCIGRPWTSGLGMGINLSILLRPPLELTAAPLLTQIASAAAGSVLEKIVPSVQIRWPNDILIKGKKCGGILTESSGEIDCINYSIIGIGLNINQEKTDFPPDLRHAAISLRMATGKKESRKQIVCAILKQLESFYFTLKKEKTATNALSFCRTHSATLGHFLAYQEGEKEQRVLAKDFDEQQGSLLIQFENGDIKALPSANRLCPLK